MVIAGSRQLKLEQRIAELEAEVESENKWASEYATKALELEAENERQTKLLHEIQDGVSSGSWAYNRICEALKESK